MTDLLQGSAVGAQHSRRPPAAGSSAYALALFDSVPRALLVLLLAASVLAPGRVERMAMAIAIIGGLVGIPHGAADHLVPWWLQQPRRKPRVLPLAAVGGAYAALAAAAALVLIAAPAVSLGVVLVLAAAHFGRGEVTAWAQRAGSAVPCARTDVLPAAAHGLAVVGLLLWARPAVSGPLVGALSPQFWAAIAYVRPVALCVVVAVVLAALSRLVTARRYREAAELALVALTFAAAPPLAAFGIYFGGWHALRHSARLLDLARAPADSGWAPAVRRLVRAAALPTVVAIGALAAMWELRSVAGVATEILVLLALTVPHAAVVAAMDRQRPGVA